ncbi:DUF2970 domain-containing protein [Paraferrimonas sedimenticola]|uniref:DUF2970 domain-containing protein n=1 Tax=Paraferrimonas sedimenticola TaxID=375674 RepID=UPI000BA932CA|nr:DUF2970 domain-containing protein [Paraferrimonas sedimenticola]
MKRLLSTVTSVLAAFFGVQSEANRRDDFQRQSPLPFIVTGLVLAALMVVGLVLLVDWVLAS